MNSTTRLPATSLRSLSSQQWKTGLAAWLGWFFDGLELHLYTLVAAPLLMKMLDAPALDAAVVKEKSSWIQAAFLVGWALGGGFFGRIGDRLGRSRALCLTILAYALFTGLSYFAQTWWHLLIFRFLTALGVGGEWAIGASLLAETWPKRWHPWIAAVLQMGVNLGILLATMVAFFNRDSHHEQTIFLIGVLPAFVVFWIRRHVPEPEEWTHAKQTVEVQPSIYDLFRGATRRVTVLCIIVCATSLSGWWAFMFWHPQHLMNLPELAQWPMAEKKGLVAQTFFWVIFISMFGNFFAGWLAQKLGYRKALALMFGGFAVTFAGAFVPAWGYLALTRFWLPAIGFWSGLFALFTMFIPPLFPTLLRTTGAGFCYNIGRIFSAVATVFAGVITAGGNFQVALVLIGLLFIPPMFVVLFLKGPEEKAAEQALVS